MRDEYGLTDEDYAQIFKAEEDHHKAQCIRALRAIWLRPVIYCHNGNGPARPTYRDAQDEEWTLWRAIKVTAAILLDRRNTKGEMDSYGVAYWDALPTYGGYTVDVVWLYPGLTYSVFNDGECLM